MIVVRAVARTEETAAMTHIIRPRYCALGIGKLKSLMEQAGFVNVRRLDGKFCQPVIVDVQAK